MSAAKDWSIQPLARIARLTMGQSPESKYYTEDDSCWPFLQGCAEFGQRLPSPALFCTQKRKIGKAGSILFSVRAPVGRINIADQDYVIGRGLAAIEGIEIDQSYLEQYLAFVNPSFRNASQGSTFEAINSSELSVWPIYLPESKPEQTKIAEILSTVDRAIEQTEALIAKQQRLKTGLMQDLLTRGIDEHGNLRSEETHQFKDSPLGRIPVEWEVRTIDELANHVGSGVTPTGGDAVYTKDGVLFLRSQNIYCDGLYLNDVAYISEAIHNTMLRSEVFENDVLLNITGASIGRCCQMPALSGKANVNQHVCAIRLNHTTNAKASFLAAVLESSIGQNQIAQFNAGGNREGLNYQQVRGFNIPWPDETEEFERVRNILGSASDALKEGFVTLNKLRVLKTALMQDLLTGRKRVTTLLEEDQTSLEP
jgi:type I restriction enzyme S subunit